MNQEQGIALLVTSLMTLWSFLVLIQILSGESSLLRISAASTGFAGFLGLLGAIVFSVLRGDSASTY